ncbi:MAG: FAD-dependent oxidoreductase, partial [Kiritimatiellae bacterium]|nr:FAD-dependent oxidoreductase [Kiritimatiellia bacterium]
MAKVAVIGAGHAGVEAAFTLAKAGAQVTLYSNEAVMPYFRPHLIGVSFGQTAPDAIAMKPAALYEHAGSQLLHQSVTQFDVAKRVVNGQSYDGIIVAQGSIPFVPSFRGDGAHRVKTLWCMEDALALRALAKPDASLVIIGGGVLGLEAALRARLAGMRVTVIEAAPVLLGGCLGGEGERVLRTTLEAKGVTLKVGASVAEISMTEVVLSDGERIDARVVLCSAGARPNVALVAESGLSIATGLATQPDLSVADGVYAAGDLARPQAGRPVCSVMRAMRMGALAARNLLAHWQNETVQPWAEIAL